MPLSTRQELVAEGKAASQLLGTQLRPVYPQKSLEAQAQNFELYRAVAEGQDLFQMLGPTSGDKGSPERGDEGCGDSV